ncbi:MAG: flagellar biosynthetic protein FliO [Ancrocorticia sp.]|jgi:flagellar biogenesis protein FliO|nr:flagellar biosynthetic protein FliO [Ancrocorticia sp.]MCI2178336.1 flagellar biosynthetic protein FliO [Ancrocorticia sp.]MCI2193142.1 flagellar biosynthetic protein FliO [Ancrocorticia sp.]MCI2198858.1 flagellar biosynthetic protein FliO [Ancrocorticia sp.]
MSDDLRLALRLVVSLLIIIALMWLFYRVLSVRMGRDKCAADVSFTVLATYRLTRRATLMVVQVQEKTLLLGVTDQYVTRLAEVAPSHSGGKIEERPGEEELSVRGKHAEVNPLEGSIISPDTWKKAWEAVRPGAHE